MGSTDRHNDSAIYLVAVFTNHEQPLRRLEAYLNRKETPRVTLQICMSNCFTHDTKWRSPETAWGLSGPITSLVSQNQPRLTQQTTLTYHHSSTTTIMLVPRLALVAVVASTLSFPVKGQLSPCLDTYASRLGVTALPNTATSQYKANFCQVPYRTVESVGSNHLTVMSWPNIFGISVVPFALQYTFIPTDNGPIEIFGGTQLSSLQLYRARKILEFYLENIPCSGCYGADKTAVKNQLALNQAKLDMPNGAHEQPGAGTSLQGQELFQLETPVEGDSWFMNNNMNHRDAAFEEILHLVHDMGIGIDGAGQPAGALPAYQTEIRAATNNAQPTWLGGNGIWAENERDWVNELAQENSLTQEYLASVIDVYYGLWAAYGAGMWGIYLPYTRAQIATLDPQGYALVPKFFSPYLTWMVMLHPSLTGTFSMTLDASLPYTHKSQYYLHATLLGSNNANIVGNDQNNCLGPNAGTNTLDGRAGNDVVLFQGNCGEYTVSCSGGTCNVQDNIANRDGLTTAVNIEKLAFRDGDFDTATMSCTRTVSALSTSCWERLDISTPTSAPAPITTSAPTARPTAAPTATPTASPTSTPATSSPTSTPATASPTSTPATDAPTSSPVTSSPTSSPTSTPATDTPTSLPTSTPMTDAPTSTPATDSPTAAPTQSWWWWDDDDSFGGGGEPPMCEDSTVARFWANNAWRTCAWLQDRPRQQDLLCGHGSAADMACIDTCYNCEIMDHCWEDSYAEHYVNSRKGYKTCQWLASRPTWQAQLCQPDQEAFYVCRETCQSGACEMWR